PFVNEAKDGYDAIEWLARQSWSNAKVGMMGSSYLGLVQWYAASLRPPHLTALISNCSPSDPFQGFPYDHGAFALSKAMEFLELTETNATGELSGKTIDSILSQDLIEMLKPLPVIELDIQVLGRKAPVWRHWLAHLVPDSYWAPAMFPA